MRPAIVAHRVDVSALVAQASGVVVDPWKGAVMLVNGLPSGAMARAEAGLGSLQEAVVDLVDLEAEARASGGEGWRVAADVLADAQAAVLAAFNAVVVLRLEDEASR